MLIGYKIDAFIRNFERVGSHEIILHVNEYRIANGLGYDSALCRSGILTAGIENLKIVINDGIAQFFIHIDNRECRFKRKLHVYRGQLSRKSDPIHIKLLSLRPEKSKIF